MGDQHPHRDTPLRTAGPPLVGAGAATILLHGRGGDAVGILGLAEYLSPAFAYLAPEAAGHTWYPHRFLAPRDSNQPWLGSAIRRILDLLDEVDAAGVPPERVLLAGFSQGACLALECGAHAGRRLGGLVAFTGGLIGADLRPEDYDPGIAGTPVVLASSDPDPHVPWERVVASARLLETLGARVRILRFPGLGHTIADDALAAARRLQEEIRSAASTDGPPSS